jgi:hypothetical protein
MPPNLSYGVVAQPSPFRVQPQISRLTACSDYNDLVPGSLRSNVLEWESIACLNVGRCANDLRPCGVQHVEIVVVGGIIKRVRPLERDVTARSGQCVCDRPLGGARGNRATEIVSRSPSKCCSCFAEVAFPNAGGSVVVVSRITSRGKIQDAFGRYFVNRLGNDAVLKCGGAGPIYVVNDNFCSHCTLPGSEAQDRFRAGRCSRVLAATPTPMTAFIFRLGNLPMTLRLPARRDFSGSGYSRWHFIPCRYLRLIPKD